MRRQRGRIARWPLVGWVLLLLVLPACAAAPPPPTAGVVYGDGERLWIAEANAEGARGQREIVNSQGKGTVSDAVWSPDRTLIAYSRLPLAAPGATFGADIHVIKPDGRDDKAVFTHDADGGLARAPAWSSDGTAIYFSYSFTRGTPGQSALEFVQQIERMDLATGTRTVVATNADLPALSPDGASLTFVRMTSDGFVPSSLWIAAADGSGARPLVEDKRFLAVWAPRFSRDGRHVLFTAFSPNPADRAGPRFTVVQPNPSSERWPPTVAAHGYPMDFWLVDVATGKLELLAALAGDDLFGAWAPDGQRIAYVTLGGLYVLDMATGAATTLAAVPAYGGLDWSGP